MRTIGIVSGSRADYGIYRPILRQIKANPNLRLSLMVTGSHLSPSAGHTVQEIEQDGFHIDERIESLLASDQAQAIAKSIGLGTIGFAQAFARNPPDVLVVLGDRFEMFAAVIAALPFNIPVAHIHGGELTFGSIDDALRHSITKMSHLHFVALEEYRARLIQLGEDPKRIYLCGAPALDNLESMELFSREKVEKLTGLSFDRPVLLVTYHSVTRGVHNTAAQIGSLISALDKLKLPTLICSPNADTGNSEIQRAFEGYVERNDNARLVGNLGTVAYYSAMKHAAAMVGNSSSGIIEAANFELPVVNIGLRQQGRLHAENVVSVENANDANAIVDSINHVISQDFHRSLTGLRNPYHLGNASSIIVNCLSTVTIDNELLVKKFHDVPVNAGASK